VEYMPSGGRRLYRLTDLLTKDELNRAMKLFIECKRTREHFTERCIKEVVEPIISRVTECAGCDASAESLVYRLEMYLRAVRGEAKSNPSLKSRQKAAVTTIETSEQGHVLTM
jgi:hypothetical protein